MFGTMQQLQFPRIAVEYVDWANRSRYQAVVPALPRSAG
jgi:hypothetical protein